MVHSTKVAAAGLLGLALLASACGGTSGGQNASNTTGSNNSSSNTSATTAGGGGTTSPAETGKVLTIGSQTAPPSLDLTSNASAAIDEVFDYNVYQHLVQLDPKGQIVPVLATSYKQSANGLTYTFDVRSGVKFSNGDPFTAADAVFSLERAKNPKNKYPYGTLLSDVKSVTSSGNTVTVTMTHPDNQFLYNLAAYSNGVELDPKAVSKIATQPVGTGPFEYSSQIPNYDVKLVPNPNYWGTKTTLAGVTFRYFTSASTENSAMTSGQIQAIDTLSNPTDASSFSTSTFKIVHGPTNGKIQMTINNAVKPLNNLLVRQAINYATNKEAILKTVGAGYGTVIGSDAVPGDPWYIPAVNNVYSYNVTKAKQLMAKAGYAKGFSTTLVVPNSYGYATGSAPIIQQELGAIGIKVSIKQIAFPLWIQQVFTAKHFDLTIIDHVEARDISNYANCAYYWNYSGCNSVATMLNKATQATTNAGMVSGFEAVVKKINADAVNDWLYNNDAVTVAVKNLIGLPTAGYTESFDLSQARFGGTTPASAVAQGYSN